MKSSCTLLFLLLFITTISYSQVVINEYSASNLSNFIDGFGKTEDWIELYNLGDDAVDLTGFHLTDKESKPEKWDFPAGTIIAAKGFLRVWCSGRDLINAGNLHTSFKLSQTKSNEYVGFSDPSGNVIDLHKMELTLVEHSRARSTDGGSEWMIAKNPSPGESNDGRIYRKSYTVEPTIDMDAGFYDNSITVSVTNNEANSVLRYTIDGNNPTPASEEYTAPLVLDKTTVVKAQSFSTDPEIDPGKMSFKTFFINESISLAVFSVAADDVINLANGDGVLIPIGSLEYFDKNKELQATSFGSLNRHGQDSWVLPHRSIDWISRDEMGYSRAVKAPLFSYSDRDDYQRFMFRNSGDDNYPAIDDYDHEGSTHIRDEYVQSLSKDAGLELDTRAVERVILFLNGEYWGVYGMRERPVDHDYTAYYYDQDKYNIQYLSTWGGTEIEYGGVQAQTDWETIRDFALNNDLSVAENYQKVYDEINLLSMIDYMVMNLNVVASDWLNYNTGWWRGLNPDGGHKKWGYILWDLDATFDYYINYSGVPNTNPDADPCDIEGIADYMDTFFGNGYGYGDVGLHEKIFLKLIQESPDFKELYYTRYADIMNTVFSCDNMINTLDSMLAVITPEMPRQIDRWGGTMTEWESNVNDLKDFILARCELLDDGALECYPELEGPYKVTLLTEPSGIGSIKFNTMDVENYPWSGDYFGGMQNNLTAKVYDDFIDNWDFSHWISTSGNVISPNANQRIASVSLTAQDTITAVFTNLTAVDNIEPNIALQLFPNPAKDHLVLSFELEEATNLSFSLYSTMGAEVFNFTSAAKKFTQGVHQQKLDLNNESLKSGMYILRMHVNEESISRKISIIK